MEREVKMEDTGTILSHISNLKDMLDQVNEEMEASIQVTREIESEIVKCSELESGLSAREADLTRALYFSHFEVDGLLAVSSESMKSVGSLEEEVNCMRKRLQELVKTMNDNRDKFTNSCVGFQKDIDVAENEEVVRLLEEKELLENEIDLLEQKHGALKNTMLAFVEEVLLDLHDCNSALNADIERGNLENEKLVREIDNLKSMLLFKCQRF